MQKPMDLIIEDFRMELADVINRQQQLPISVVAMIVNEMYAGVNSQYSNYMAELREGYQRELEKEAEQVVKSE